MLIYKITNLIDGKSYIGQTTKKTFDARYSGRNWHKVTHNNHLKRAVVKYGLENFAVQILEEQVVSTEELDRLEKFHIEKHGTLHPCGYNFAGGGHDIHSLHSDTKEKISDAHSKVYELIDFEGNEYRVTHMKRFCKQKGLRYENLKIVMSGENISSQGFALKGTPLNLIENPNKLYRLKNIETGEIVEFKCIRGFARLNGIEHTIVQMLTNGSRKTPFGKWANVNLDMEDWWERVERSKIKIVNRDGDAFEVGFNNEEFARKHPPLRREDLQVLLNGSVLERKGWRLETTTKEDVSQSREKAKNTGVYIFKREIDEEPIIVQNLLKFCEENDLLYYSMQKLTSGKLKCHKGYVFVKKIKGFEQKTYRKLVFENTDTKEIICAKNSSELWRKMRGKIPKNRMFDIIREKMKSYNNWTLKEKEST